MRKSRVLAVVLAVTATGCFARGRIRFTENPDLAPIRLATGEPLPVKDNLGLVEGRAAGAGSCNRVAADALRDLLGEARARGATTVEDVKFRGRWHWTGHVLCKRYLPFLPGLYSVQARGVAVAGR